MRTTTTLDLDLKPMPGRLWRVLRVFVSSTFADMQEERDELAKWVFPAIRQLCESRGIVWGDVDLRWGISDEQHAEAQVLPICLEEIRNCHPFFIGLLGERYGWDDFELPADLLEREPWLSFYQGRSITEIEMLYGALLETGRGPKHAFFYFRDPTYAATVPREREHVFRESPRPEEVKVFGWPAAGQRAASRRERLAKLKERVRASGLTVHDYAIPRDCGELVKRDFSELIDRLFPEEERPSKREREKDLHDAALWNLAEVEVADGVRQGAYVGRQEYAARLDRHAGEEGPPLVILGDPGIGKSALLANWWLRYRQAHPKVAAIVHVVGASPSSTTATGTLTRLIDEIGASFGGSFSGRSLEEQSAALQVFLGVASDTGHASPLLLILDGLDKLENRDDDHDLHWLPDFPKNVRVLIAAGPGRAREALRRRGWPMMTIEPLEHKERRELIQRYLAGYRKTLESGRVARLVASDATAHPLFLRAMLDEIRLLGHPRELDAAIADYLSASTLPDLFGRILARFERDYERERPALVGDAMRALWAARIGLADAELLDVLGEPGKPLPVAYWAPLRHALGRSLLDRSGVLAFSHRYLGEAVASRYLESDDARVRAHTSLADYFAQREEDPRSIEELPWQLEQSNQWERLGNVLSKPEYLSGMAISDEYALRRMWTGVERHTPTRLKDVLGQAVVQTSTLSPAMLATLDGLSWSGGDYGAAREAVDELIRRLDPERDAYALAYMLKQSADIHQRLDHRETTLELLNRARAIFKRFSDASGEAACLRTETAHWISALEHEKALECAERAVEISRRIGDRKGLRTDLTNCGALLTQLDRVEEAIHIHAEEEPLARELEDWDGLAKSLNNQGSLHLRRHHPRKALALFNESEQLATKYSNSRSRIIALAGRANAHAELGDMDHAFEQSQEARRLSLESQDLDLVTHCVVTQAMLFHAFSATQRDQLLAEISQHRNLAEAFRVALRGRVEMLERVTVEETMIFEHAFRRLEGQGEEAPRERARRLIARAADLLRQSSLHEAKETLEKAEKIAKEDGARSEARDAASDLAGLLKRMGRLDDALAKIREARVAAAEDGDEEAEQMALANEATLLWEMAMPTGDRQRLKDAWSLAEKSREICERRSLKERLAFVLGTCGLIARFLDRWDDARACFERQVSVAQEVGDPDLLGRALLNYAVFNLEAGNSSKLSELATALAGMLDRIQDPDSRMRATRLLKQLGMIGVGGLV